MTDRWLPVLNYGHDQTVCRGPLGNYSMAQMRRLINKLRAAILENGKYDWVLYDEDGFRFICALFALLTTGRRILIPQSKHRTIIEPLLDADTGLMGFQKELQDIVDIEILTAGTWDPDVDIPVESPTSLNEQWGKISFSTSGSSGQPKNISKSSEQLFLEAKSLLNTWKPASNTLFVPLVTHLHMYGLAFAFLLPMMARAGIYLTRNSGMLGVAEPLNIDANNNIESLIVVTSPTIGRQSNQIDVLKESASLVSDDRPAPVSRVFCAGGKLTDTNAGAIAQLFGCPVTEIFGSTETGAVATREHINSNQLGQEKLWRLIPGLEAGVVVGKSLFQNAPDLCGEFAVWGAHVGGSRDAPVLSGDEVTFLCTNGFQLIGRSNDTCKIEGKRISLAFVVNTIKSSAIVNEAIVLPHQKNGKEVLLSGITLSADGLTNYQQEGKAATDKAIRNHLIKLLDPVLVPRSIRYLDKIPHNEMGKLPRSSLNKILVNPEYPELPLLENQQTGTDQMELTLRIPLELRHLKGHFDNRPIVPGIVLLHWIYHYTNHYWKVLLDPAAVNRLKFSHPVSPGYLLALTIQRNANGVEFKYLGENKTKFASGQIPYSPGTLSG